MSNPTRNVGRKSVPVINTQQARVEKAASSLGFNGWPLTPPQSAHESRRSSLAGCPFFEPPVSVNSSSHVRSQPTTPTHAIHETPETSVHQWLNSYGSDICPTEYPIHSTNAVMLQQPFRTSFDHQGFCGSTESQTSTLFHSALGVSYSGRFDVNGPPIVDINNQWIEDGRAMNSNALDSAGLHTTLYPTAHGLGLPCAGASSLHAGLGHLTPSHASLAPVAAYQTPVDSFGPTLPLVYQHSHGIAPTQLSPGDDFALHQYSHDASPHDPSKTFSTSYGSTGGSLSSYECVRPPSPDNAYFVTPEEGDYTEVKYEASYSPTPPQTSLRGYRTSGIKKARRTSKRGKAVTERHEITTLNFIFEVEIESEGQKKTFVCDQMKNGKMCNAHFRRGEHLKRHQLSHEKNRKFTCPLPNCPKNTKKDGEKGIGRGDNAGDHFKTHLKRTEHGRRNQECDWQSLKAALLRTSLDLKATNKLISNIEKWIRTHPDGAYQIEHYNVVV